MIEEIEGRNWLSYKGSFHVSEPSERNFHKDNQKGDLDIVLL